MKVVFVSNYFNHHQKPFCDEMYQRLGTDFSFISTSVMREERKKLGYTQDNFPDYVCLAYENKQQWDDAVALINDVEVVIAGSAPHEILKERIRSGKLLLRYSERLYKKKCSFLRKIYHAMRFRFHDYGNKNIYMLCASAYTARDYVDLGLYKKRTYKWGYFPEVKEYDIDVLMSQKKRNTFMWCGRFIDWKHPDDAVMIAHKLKEEGYDFQLNFVGTGIMEEELHQLVENYRLTDCVHFLGSMPPEQVRGHMEEAGIYLFTSDQQEGWGAVLNESMNSGCAVVASHAIGSVPFLIQDGINGLVYPSGNIDALFEKVKYLLAQQEEQERLGRAAYQTIVTEWNAETAADRLMQLLVNILTGEEYPDLYNDGPCSKAKVIQDKYPKESF